MLPEIWIRVEVVRNGKVTETFLRRVKPDYERRSPADRSEPVEAILNAIDEVSREYSL